MKKFKESLFIIGESLFFMAILIQILGYLLYRYIEHGITFGLFVGIIFLVLLSIKAVFYLLKKHNPRRRYFRVRVDGHDFYTSTTDGLPNTDWVLDHETHYVEEISKGEYLEKYQR